MDAGRHKRGLQTTQTNTGVANGRPAGAGHPIFTDGAAQLFENGYEPIPIRPNQKAPAVSRWTSVTIDKAVIAEWSVRHPTCGIGLRTGRLVGIDIDVLDPDRAHAAQALAFARFGETLVRVGLWPKRLLLYRTDTPFPKMKSGQIEVLGAGQQFVAFGMHPGTGQPYGWPFRETPLDVPLADLPVIYAAAASAFLAECGPGDRSGGARIAGPRHTPAGSGDPARDTSGMVIDGRDAWLSQIAFHAVHDALEAGETPQLNPVALQVWQRFTATTDLDRPRQDRAMPYALSDATRKVSDKLRLARDGRLPSRDRDVPEPDTDAPTLTVAEGRVLLSDTLAAFCADVVQWHQHHDGTMPALGIRATVGLGKSRVARDQLLALAAQLRQLGLPHRILVFTPSHALAEETAAAWSAAGARVAVLRGYERTEPISGDPMCRDLEAVRAALAAGQNVRDSACAAKDGQHCRFFAGCRKQQNLRDVADADVVVAPYDALFSGLAFARDDVALLMIDEGCWARALEQQRGISVEGITVEPVSGMGGQPIGRGPTGAMADLVAIRGKVASALVMNGPGPVTRSSLQAAGVTAAECRHAAQLERWRLQDTGLVPGMPAALRARSFAIAAANARILQLAALWQALAALLEGGQEMSGQISIAKPDAVGHHPIILRRIRGLHESLRAKPVLHLDATMRPELLRQILPQLAVTLIDVAAPHMHVRMVSGSFGKSMLCPADGLPLNEARRRTNRLRECVDYVRWHAQRVWPAR
ncbi:bifunctional DNA primase/polymerase, partial [Loktanella sp. DJP18]|uniref:bifunctional DNA primase/polymerase n=1 Tax=Loktanella sp. DJP18 TaxID=3409788 RepID=UPI003BB7011F